VSTDVDDVSTDVDDVSTDADDVSTDVDDDSLTSADTIISEDSEFEEINKIVELNDNNVDVEDASSSYDGIADAEPMEDNGDDDTEEDDISSESNQYLESTSEVELDASMDKLFDTAVDPSDIDSAIDDGELLLGSYIPSQSIDTVENTNEENYWNGQLFGFDDKYPSDNIDDLYSTYASPVFSHYEVEYKDDPLTRKYIRKFVRYIRMISPLTKRWATSFLTLAALTYVTASVFMITLPPIIKNVIF